MNTCSGYLSKHGYVLKKEDLSTDSIAQLKNDLVARPLQDTKFAATQATTFPVYIETKNKIYVPRRYGLDKFGEAGKMLRNYLGQDTRTPLSFQGSLRESQIEPYERLRAACLEEGGGVLQLHTGGGKTFIAIKLIADLGKKTLIVVNKIPLMEQWKKEIQMFLPCAKVGILQGQKNVSVVDCDIVIGMLQSLAQIDYPDALFEDFGCVVIDEIHNISSKVFSKILFKLSSLYMVGLSATPERADGLSYVYKWHIGGIIFKSQATRDGLHPVVQLYKAHSDKYIEHSTTNKFTGKKQIQFTQMLTELTEMPGRNRFIVSLICQFASQGRKVLVLSDRRQHLMTLESHLKKKNVDFSFGLFLGQMKISQLEQSKRANVILATYKAFGEGVSERDLDTLVLTTPKKFVGHLQNTTKKEAGSLEQIVGRIFRKTHESFHPVIADIQDQFSVYKNQASQRLAFYKSHFENFRIETHVVNEWNLEDSRNVHYLLPRSTTTDHPVYSKDCLLD
jgi:superfamily II DNA or RNA helicase